MCWSEFRARCHDDSHTWVSWLTSTPHCTSCSIHNTLLVKIPTDSPLLDGKVLLLVPHRLPGLSSQAFPTILNKSLPSSLPAPHCPALSNSQAYSPTCMPPPACLSGSSLTFKSQLWDVPDHVS